MKKLLLTVLLGVLLYSPLAAAPLNIIFDTDVGNDVDDVLALSVLHALQARAECKIVGVTITKPDELAGPFVDAMNTFYHHPEIPIGCIRPNPNEPPSRFLHLANQYPHQLKRGSDAPEPVRLLMNLLAAQPDGSVVLVQVGYFSNFAALLDTPGALALIKRKVKFLSIMGGAFSAAPQKEHFLEFNVVKDIASSRKVAAEWPTPIVWSGFEIGVAVPYPAVSIERDFKYAPHHPAAEAYYLYNPPPHERPTWDLTAALFAVRPDRGYFDLSAPGQVSVDEDGFTRFTPKADGRDRYLILNPGQIPKVKEALVELASQPPIKP